MNQHVHFLGGADGDAQEFVDSGLVKVANQDAPVPELLEQRLTGHLGVAGKHEICLGGQHRKAQIF